MERHRSRRQVGPAIFLLNMADITISWVGSTNTDCVGLVSSSGNSTIIQQQEAAAKALSRSKHKHTVIVVVSVLFSLLFVIGFILASFFHLRKRLKRADDEIDEITARPLIGSGTRSILSIQGMIASAINKTPRLTTSPVQPAGGPPSMPSPTTPSPSTNTPSVINQTPSQARPVSDGRPFSVSDYNSFGDSPTTSSRSTYTLPLPHFANFPLTSIRASQNLNRARTGRRASGAEAESFHNDYLEPALSDSGSNVLPRLNVLEAGGRRNLVTNSRQLRGSRQDSEGSRHFRNSSTTLS